VQIAPLENDISTKPISVDAAKTWFQQQQVGNNNANPTDDSLMILSSGVPNWDSAFNDVNRLNRAFVVAPLQRGGEDGRLNSRLLVTRRSDGSLMGVMMVYLANQAYHNRTNGYYNTLDFTGIVAYSDLNGRFLFGFNVENGVMKQAADAIHSSGTSTQIGSDRTGGVTLRECGTYSERGKLCGPHQVFSPDCVDILFTIRYCTYPDFGGHQSIEPGTWTGGNSGNTGGSNGNGGSNNTNNWGGSQPSGLLNEQSLSALREKFRLNNASDIFEAYETDVTELRNIYNFLKPRNFDITTLTSLRKYLDAGFQFPEFKAIFSDQSLLDQTDIFLNEYSSLSDFKTKIRYAMNPYGLVSTTEKIARLKGFIKFTKSFKSELEQLVQQDRTFITSGGDMNILMRIFGKVLGKKIGQAIPFIGAAINAEAAWTAYNLGNMGEAAFALAGVALDLIPVGVAIETGYTIVAVAFDVFKAYKPIIALSEFLATNRVLLDALIETLDDLNLFSNIDLIPTTKSAISQFKITLGNRTVQEFLTTLEGHLGVLWQNTTWGKYLEISPTFKLSFYPVDGSFGSPAIQIELNGVKFKIRLQ
jgi:hypothetical protein